MKVGIFQPEAAPSTPNERLARLGAALEAQQDLDLMICPELFLSGFADPDLIAKWAETSDGPSSQAAAAIARNHGVALVYGYPESADGKLYNAALYISKSGDKRINHRKRALPTPYEESLFTVGSEASIFTLDSGLKAGILICYEAEFPEAVRACAIAGADLVIVPTALGIDWRVVSRQVMRARAFESGVFLAYANHAGTEGAMNYIGDSVIISPLGEDMARAGSGETVITADIDISTLPAIRQRLPFLRDYKSFRTAHD